MTLPAVVFEHVTRTFGRHIAVDDVSFEVAAGRVVGLLGPNGAGKTTSLRILLGLTAPTSGSVHVLGHPAGKVPDAGRRIGVTMEGIGPVRGASGRRELSVWATALGIPRDRIDEVLDLVELTGQAHRRVSRYSTGMRQRLALAVALLTDPELLVLDEPSNGLDPEGIRWLRRTLRALADQGTTVVVSTHILSELEQSVDDVVVIKHSLRFAGTLDEFTTTASVEDRYFELVGERRPDQEVTRA
ncbi:MAG: ATP-binding cassette domain-containing protein [Promicromonosporaceae bacterium]|nr:ATP-binding cassette domain-containing protein [Promicromonosporaceae bacterium]